jgi:hypothetical protein
MQVFQTGKRFCCGFKERATGSALKRKPPVRPKNVRTPENIATVRESIERSPTRSARKHASALRISDRTVKRILQTDLHLHPYKIMIGQELSPADWGRRMNCCNGILAQAYCGVATKPISIFQAQWTNNFRYWAAENPRELHAPLHSPNVSVWCTQSSIGVIGPYLFEEGGVTVTVNSNRYCDMLENFLRPKIEAYGEEHTRMELRPIQHVVRAQFWRCSRVAWSPYTRQCRGHRARLI